MLTRIKQQRALRTAAPGHFLYQCETCKGRYHTVDRPAYEGNAMLHYDCSECVKTAGLLGDQAIWIGQEAARRVFVPRTVLI